MTEVGGYVPLSWIVATFGFYVDLFVPFHLVTHPCKNLWTKAPGLAYSQFVFWLLLSHDEHGSSQFFLS